jgi:PEP-CTERM motif
MTIIARRSLMFLAVAVLLPWLAQTAKADTEIDFACAKPFAPCGGGPVTGGPPFATLGITNLFASSGTLTPFEFTFNTGLGTAKLVDSTNTLTGVIEGATTANSGGASTNISFSVLWDMTYAPDIAAYLSAPPSYEGLSQVFFTTSNGAVTSATISISGVAVSPVPEPGSIALLGTGLLFCGWLLRRRKQPEEATSEIL